MIVPPNDGSNPLKPGEYRKKHAAFFRHNGTHYEGFKPGVMNGPDASTPRGKRRAAKRAPAPASDS